MNNLIAISGKANAGKDFVGAMIQYLSAECSDENSSRYRSFETFLQRKTGANEFQMWYSSPYEIKKFADKLKDIICILIGCTRLELENRDFKEKFLGTEWTFNDIIYTPRLLLQVIGTDLFRKQLHPNIWVNALFSEYEPTHKPGLEHHTWDTDPLPSWIITDTRFKNEADIIKKKGGLLIRVERPCSICNQIGFHKLSCNNNIIEHLSETDLDDYNKFDYIIKNTGSVDELLKKVKKIYAKNNIS